MAIDRFPCPRILDLQSGPQPNSDLKMLEILVDGAFRCACPNPNLLPRTKAELHYSTTVTRLV